jgi:hypothetical protein
VRAWAWRRVVACGVLVSCWLVLGAGWGGCLLFVVTVDTPAAIQPSILVKHHYILHTTHALDIVHKSYF